MWADNSDNHHRNATWTFVISGSLIVMIPWVPANPTMLIGILIVQAAVSGLRSQTETFLSGLSHHQELAAGSLVLSIVV